MRKVLLLAILLLSAVMSVSAIGEVELSALARYVPDDALVYAGLRTDDDFLASVDALISKGLPFLPPNQVPDEFSLRDTIDEFLGAMSVGTFDDAIRPWLGNTGAVVMFSPSEEFADPDVLVIVEADGAAAEAFLEPFLEAGMQEGDIEYSYENDLAIYASLDDFDSFYLAFAEDAIFFSNVADYLPVEAVATPLSDSEDFNTALSSLPADNYSIVAYINTLKLQSFNFEQAGMEMSPMMEDLLSVNSSVALGFTGDENALIMDVAQIVDYSAFEEYGVTLTIPSALDMSFTNRIPADAFAVLQSSDFGSTTQAGLNNLRALGEYIKANGGLAELVDPTGEEIDDEDERRVLNQVDIAWALGALNLGFAGGTGLSLENDVLPTLDGDAALYLRVLPSPNFISPVIPDGAILFGASDSAAAEAMVNQLGEAATAYDQVVKTEGYGNGSAIVFSAEDTMGFSYPSLDLLIGASDDLFALGTREAVTASLNTSGGLADDATFQAAMQYVLPDSQNLAYLATEPVFVAIDPLFEQGVIPMDSDTEDAYRLISIVQSATVSVVVQSDGTSLARFVISLNDAPRPLPDSPDA